MQRQAQIRHPDVQTSRCAQTVCLPRPNGDNKKDSTAYKLSRQHLLHSNVDSINSGTDISICSLLENIIFLPTQGSNGVFLMPRRVSVSLSLPLQRRPTSLPISQCLC